MLKNILCTVFSIVALACSPTLLAAEPADAETPPAATMPADSPVQPAPVAQSIPVTEVVPASASNARPLHDNHVDYRYCLELKSDREIIECRYKKNK
jgi:hypothetical protein